MLTMLITADHMAEYNRIHQTLLLLKQTRWTLEHLSFRRGVCICVCVLGGSRG